MGSGTTKTRTCIEVFARAPARCARVCLAAPSPSCSLRARACPWGRRIWVKPERRRPMQKLAARRDHLSSSGRATLARAPISPSGRWGWARTQACAMKHNRHIGAGERLLSRP